MSDFTSASHADDRTWTAPQQYEPAPPPQRNKRLFIGLGIAALIVVGGIAGALVTATSGGSSAKKIAVHGTVTIADFEGFAPDDPNVDDSKPGVSGPCHAISGYDDIAQGAEVVISEDAGKTLTITELGAGSFDSNGACAFSFTAQVPAGKKFYGITVTHRGTVKFKETELAHAGLSIGS